MSEKKSFWGTLPGIITGTATVITAGLGLWAAVANSGVTGDTKASPTPTVSPSASATPSSSLSPEALVDELPKADVVPVSVEFEDLGLGRAASKTITVVNSGQADLEIYEVAIGGEGADKFKVVQDTCASESIAPGSRCQITLEFSPPTVGSFLATLELNHNAQDTPTKVPLSGKGILLELN
jgi:centrosomal CEP192-like protein